MSGLLYEVTIGPPPHGASFSDRTLGATGIMSNSAAKTCLIIGIVAAALVAVLVVVFGLLGALFWLRVASPTEPLAPPERPRVAEVPAAPQPATVQTRRDPKWAAPIKKQGLPNLHKVGDRLYRGAQPTAEGMEQLKTMGVRTVINLRKFHSDRDEIGETSLAYEHIYFNPLHPEDKEVVRFLQIVTDKARTPAFVHCQHGADRTGTMCALYRIVVQGWSKQEAIREMTDGGFGHHEALFGNLRNYIRKLDLDAICTRAGVERRKPAASTRPDAPASGRQ